MNAAQLHNILGAVKTENPEIDPNILIRILVGDEVIETPAQCVEISYEPGKITIIGTQESPDSGLRS